MSTKKAFTKETTCDGKRVFDSLAEASKAAASQSNHGAVKKRMEGYRCPFCLKYHYGHAKKKSGVEREQKRPKLNPNDYECRGGKRRYCIIRKSA